MEKEKANLIVKKFFELNRCLKIESDLQKQNVMDATRVCVTTFIRWRTGTSMPFPRDVEKIADLATNCNEVMRLKNLKKQIEEMLNIIGDAKKLDEK